MSQHVCISVPSQGEKSVYTNCGRRQHGYRTKDPTWSSRNFVHIIQNIFVHLCYTRQLDGCKQWMYKKSNAKISDCQTSKETFRWKVNGRHLMKCNKDQRIAQWRGDGKKNVQSWKKAWKCGYWGFRDCSALFNLFVKFSSPVMFVVWQKMHEA